MGLSQPAGMLRQRAAPPPNDRTPMQDQSTLTARTSDRAPALGAAPALPRSRPLIGSVERVPAVDALVIGGPVIRPSQLPEPDAAGAPLSLARQAGPMWVPTLAALFVLGSTGAAVGLAWVVSHAA